MKRNRFVTIAVAFLMLLSLSAVSASALPCFDFYQDLGGSGGGFIAELGWCLCMYDLYGYECTIDGGVARTKVGDPQTLEQMLAEKAKPAMSSVKPDSK